jgi:hypothetical protein
MPMLSVSLLALAILLPAQTAPPPQDCSAPEHRQFDFWIGKWTVTSQGKPAGVNHIEADLKNCVLIERWTAEGGGKGTSLNFYDRTTKAWYQTWIDERGGVLRLKGGLVGQRMVMQSDIVPNQSGAGSIQRITWSIEPDGSVRQLWDASTDGGKSWTIAFDGRYVKSRAQTLLASAPRPDQR